MSSNYWYYSVGNQSKGPISKEKLSEMFKTGRLSKETSLVWTEGFQKWELACNIEDFSSIEELSPPPLPVPPPITNDTESSDFQYSYGQEDEESDIYNNLSEYYKGVFKKFDLNNGSYVFTWNWAAFFFGMFWYLSKGMWGKVLIFVLAAIITGGYGFILFWLYFAIFGKYDYYLLVRRKTQWW
jgi:hypothetical protein